MKLTLWLKWIRFKRFVRAWFALARGKGAL